jgi:ADP-heptose:LPS heptosyltransferase
MGRVRQPDEVGLGLDAFPLSPGRTTSAANPGGTVVDISLYDDLEVALSEASGVRPVVAGATLLHPGRSHAEHAWPATRWAVVAEDATAAGHHVVVLAEEDEDEVAWQVAGLAGLGRRSLLTTPTDLVELLALVAAAERVLTDDLALARLAWVAGTPSLVLAATPVPTPPPGPHVLVTGDRLAAIEVDEVLDALVQLPRRRGQRRAR